MTAANCGWCTHVSNQRTTHGKALRAFSSSTSLSGSKSAVAMAMSASVMLRPTTYVRALRCASSCMMPFLRSAIARAVTASLFSIQPRMGAIHMVAGISRLLLQKSTQESTSAA